MSVVARRFPLLLAAAILLAVAAYLRIWSPVIADWTFLDPDDQLRLQEVRDFVAGQAWSDVSQHRLGVPWGAPMHWSRLVDLPLTAVMLALRPLLGVHGAELAAVLAVPALTLAAAMILVALLGRRLAGPAEGLVAAALLPLTTGAMQQLRPLRIDHHGWQIVLALGIALALLDRRPVRGARLAGVLAALWLTISLEGLPFCVLAGALLAGRFALDRQDARLAGYVGALALATPALFLALRDAAAWRMPACDAVAPVHLIVLGLAALGVLAATRVRSRPLALALLGGTGAACALAYVAVDPACTRGAFAALDPLVMRYWYLNVSEGLPVWRISGQAAATAIGYPLVALAGAALWWRHARDRAAWLDYALLLLAATLVTAAVQRAGNVANVLALPAGVALMRLTLMRIERWRPGPGRVLGSAAALTLMLPTAPALAALAAGSLRPATGKAATPPSRCRSTRDYAATAALPPSALMTNLDVAAGILFTTRHRLVASGHHRNARGIHDVIATFIGSPSQARTIMAARGIDYLVVCADMEEMGIYRDANPRGFWAQLAAGRRFAWAEPVRLRGTRLSVWRIRR